MNLSIKLAALPAFACLVFSADAAVLARYLAGSTAGGAVGQTIASDLAHAGGVTASDLTAKDSGIRPLTDNYNGVAFSDAGNGHYWAYFTSINFTNAVNTKPDQYPSRSTNGRSMFSASAAADTQLELTSLTLDLATAVSDAQFAADDISVLYTLFYRIDGGSYVELSTGMQSTGYVGGAYGFTDLGTISFDLSEIEAVTGTIDFVVSLGMLDQKDRSGRGARTVAISNIVLNGEAVSTIPEPSGALLGIAVVGLAFRRRRQE